MHEGFLVAVIRGNTKEDAVEIAKEVFKGGIRSLEITFTTPDAAEVIAELTLLEIPGMIVGAGTVLDEVTARFAIMKGARYIVSPHFDRNISLLCNRYAIPYLPGCGSVTEILEATTYGSDVIKLFPGSLLGKSFIKDVHGPLPHVQMMPSGGVSKDNLADWINVGAFAVGIGSALTKGITKGDYSSVQKEAREFIDLLHSIKSKELLSAK